MKRIAPYLLSTVLGAVTVLAPAPAQEKSHDALAHPLAKAAAENQRVLLFLRGGDTSVDKALSEALADYRKLGKELDA